MSLHQKPFAQRLMPLSRTNAAAICPSRGTEAGGPQVVANRVGFLMQSYSR